MERAHPVTAACALGILAAATARAQAPAAPAASAPTQEEPTAEIVIEGRHEGPRMWKVESANHTVWILGTITPLPKKMVWEPVSVQEVLHNSQEVVPAWPTYGIGYNPITALRLYIAWRRLQRPPDHMTLKQSLPAPLYARVESLKARYLPQDSALEEMRPMIAARELLTKVFDATGLALHNEVQAEVLTLARSAGVRVRQDKLKIEDPVNVLKDVGATPLQGEIACLESVVTLLESDIPLMQTRARAWALGDVETLRRLPYAEDRGACLAAISTSERVRSLIARAEDDWLIAVQESLEHNSGTLAVQSMDRLLGANGALAALKAKGYRVEGP
ncbi:MAG TPA: TraB/GumN family protein [Steroidobacteraceae bacterium]|nr:TraB/GumN family protein [Steroidobacteraceae bacterium]